MTRPHRALRILAKVLLAAAATAILFELACQLYAAHVMRQQHALRLNPDHYYVPSSNAVLAYELSRNLTLRREGRTLQLNRHGIRDDRDELPAADRIVALLGDSVVFGKGITQTQTVSALLQATLDPSGSRVKVLNLGVPGYNLPELVEHLKVKNAIYHATHIIYILNPNDFCRRNTRYEGADNGLYRMYCPPWLKSPWFLRKLLYDFHKGKVVSIGWYRWLYKGNRDRALEIVNDMAVYAESQHAAFTVLLLPARCAYVKDTYELADMYEDIRGTLASKGIEVISPIDTFAQDPTRFFTETDHLTPQGNQVMSDIIAGRLAEDPK